MKKKLIIIGLIIVAIMGFCSFCYYKDNIRFKISYEFLNLVEDSNGKIVKVDIPIDNKIEYVNGKKLISILKEETGVVYFGYSACPWCRSVIGSLIDAVKEEKIGKLYYVNIKDDLSDVKEELFELLDGYLRDENGKKAIASPNVFFIKDGKIMKNYVGANDVVDYPYKEITEKEKNKLKQMYIDGIEMIK